MAPNLSRIADDLFRHLGLGCRFRHRSQRQRDGPSLARCLQAGKNEPDPETTCPPGRELNGHLPSDPTRRDDLAPDRPFDWLAHDLVLRLCGLPINPRGCDARRLLGGRIPPDLSAAEQPDVAPALSLEGVVDARSGGPTAARIAPGGPFRAQDAGEPGETRTPNQLIKSQLLCH